MNAGTVYRHRLAAIVATAMMVFAIFVTADTADKQLLPTQAVDVLAFASGTVADLMVTDPAGRRTGRDAATGTRLQEIPSSSHFIDSIQDDVTGAPASDSSHQVDVSKPSTGLYTVVLVGVTTGAYTLKVDVLSSDGAHQHVDVNGFIAAGGSATITVDLKSPTAGALSVTRPVTFVTLREDIRLAGQLKFIDSVGVAQSVSMKVSNAERLSGIPRGQILNALMNEIRALTGKQIQPAAAAILLTDIDALLHATSK